VAAHQGQGPARAPPNISHAGPPRCGHFGGLEAIGPVESAPIEDTQTGFSIKERNVSRRLERLVSRRWRSSILRSSSSTQRRRCFLSWRRSTSGGGGGASSSFPLSVSKNPQLGPGCASTSQVYWGRDHFRGGWPSSHRQGQARTRPESPWRKLTGMAQARAPAPGPPAGNSARNAGSHPQPWQGKPGQSRRSRR